MQRILQLANRGSHTIAIVLGLNKVLLRGQGNVLPASSEAADNIVQDERFGLAVHRAPLFL